MREHFYAVIMAGGGGTRLWPISRRERPKQLIKFSSNESLFQMAVNRLEGLFPPERIFVVTNAGLANKLQPQCPNINKNNFIIEPSPKGTAPAVGLAAAVIKERDRHPETTMAVLTADHFIQNIQYFHELLESAFDLASDGFLVTLGIKPTFPSTGFGYINRGEQLGSYKNIPAYKVVKFVEKPDEGKAKSLVASGFHDWNSGMFIWRVDRILDEFQLHMPDLASELRNLINHHDGNRKLGENLSFWKDIKMQTIDYGIMEKALNVAVIPTSGLGWYDVGSWDSLFDVLPKDENGNIIVGSSHLGLNTEHSIIFSENAHKLIVTIGIQNLIVVDTGDTILICQRNEAQNVKKVIDVLENSGRQEYL